MTNEEREEMRKDMLTDAHEKRANQRHEHYMRTDWEYFRDETTEAHELALNALRDLKSIYAEYEIEFSILMLGDEI